MNLIDTKGPLVSIIMPTYNHARFIGEGIESVLNQTYKNFELIIIDNFSEDNTEEIVASYKDDRIKYLKFRNNGSTGVSRNYGIRHAKGEYIAFLDSDDFWLPEKLEEQVAVLRAYPQVAMVYGPGYFFYDMRAGNGPHNFLQPLGLDGNRVVNPPSLFKMFIRNFNITPSPSGILISRELTRYINGFEEDFRGIYRIVDDQVFYAKITLHYPVYVDSRCWYHYRLHSHSCGAQTAHKKTMSQAQVKFFYWLKDYINTLPDSISKQVNHRVDRYLWESLMDEIMTRQYCGHWIIGPLRKRIALYQEMVSRWRKMPRVFKYSCSFRSLSGFCCHIV